MPTKNPPHRLGSWAWEAAFSDKRPTAKKRPETGEGRFVDVSRTQKTSWLQPAVLIRGGRKFIEKNGPVQQQSPPVTKGRQGEGGVGGLNDARQPENPFLHSGSDGKDSQRKAKKRRGRSNLSAGERWRRPVRDRTEPAVINASPRIGNNKIEKNRDSQGGGGAAHSTGKKKRRNRYKDNNF